MIKKITRLVTGKRFGIGFAVALVLVGVAALFNHSTVTFRDGYETYAGYAEAQERNAYIPGATANPIRQQLNQLLTEILASKVSDAKRLQDARNGLALINEARQQIDVIGDRGGPVDQAIGSLESEVSPLNAFVTRGKTNEIVALAKKRADLISDIRAYSYRADFETTGIFNQVINDKGKLTSAYVTDLNNKIPDLEAQFNQRSNLYIDLENTSRSIHDDVKQLSWF